MSEYELSEEEASLDSKARTLIDLVDNDASGQDRENGILTVHTVLVVQNRHGGLGNPGVDAISNAARGVHEHHGVELGDRMLDTMVRSEAVLDDSITVEGEVSS